MTELHSHLLLTTAVPGVLQDGSTGPAGREAPIRTIIRQNREEGVEPLQRREFPTTLVVSLITAATLLSVLAWWINRRASRSVKPAEAATQTLSRRLRVGRQGRLLLHELERATGVPELAMLASRTALRTAMDAPEAHSLSGQPGWAKLHTLAYSGGVATG